VAPPWRGRYEVAPKALSSLMKVIEQLLHLKIATSMIVYNPKQLYQKKNITHAISASIILAGSSGEL